MEIELSESCCRTCLRSGNTCILTPLSSDDEDSVKLSFKLVSCISEVVWLHDCYPKFICDHCIGQLRISYDFRNACLSANQTLRDYIKETSAGSKTVQKDILYDDIEANSTPQTINSLATEDASNSEYLQLKHFLENDEEIVNNESGSNASRSSTPKSNSGRFLTSYNYSQTVQMQAQDVQEIIIHEEIEEQNRVTFGAGDDCSINGLKIEHSEFIRHENKLEPCNNESCEEANTILGKNLLEDGELENTVRISYAEAPEEIILEPNQVIPVKEISDNDIPKVTKIAAVQVKPSTREHKEPLSSTHCNMCGICGNIYKKKSNLKIHMRIHTGEKPFECKYCFKRFYHSSHLKEHIRRHTGEKPYPCNVCGKRFTIKGELTMHMKSHTGEKPYSCSVCDRRCLTSTDLKIHMRTHTGEKPYSCDHCDKKFRSSYILNSHLKVHTGDRPHACSLCDKNFTQSSHLNVHMKKHTGEKFECRHCLATFSHASQLTVHRREHSGKQPFKCEVCGKTCNYSSELQSHMQKHTGQKATCNICHKQFTSNAYLQEHTRVHTGDNLFSCTICDRRFTRKHYLQKHYLTHTGEKPFSCYICSKTFTQNSSLKVHLRIHTGERPYQCTVCQKAFITSSDLTAHSKTHKKYINL